MLLKVEGQHTVFNVFRSRICRPSDEGKLELVELFALNLREIRQTLFGFGKRFSLVTKISNSVFTAGRTNLPLSARSRTGCRGFSMSRGRSGRP